MTDSFEEPLDEQLTQLFALARSAGTTEELSLEGSVVAAMARVVAEPPLVSALDQRRRLAASRVGVRAAIVVAALLVGTSTVAAATGNLPDAAQSAVARATSHVGISLPNPHDDRDPTSTSSAPSSTLPVTTPVTEPGDAPTALVISPPPATPLPASTTAATSLAAASTTAPEPEGPTTAKTGGVGPDPDGPAKQGLCQAWASHGEGSPANEHSTAMARLQEAAAAAGQTVDQFCAPIVPAPTTDVVPPTSPEPGTDTTTDDKPPKDDKVPNDHKPAKDETPAKDEKPPKETKNTP